jgi:hypothetical protein
MNVMHWLTENDIIRDVIDKIQQMEVHGNYDITANVVKREKKGGS